MRANVGRLCRALAGAILCASIAGCCISDWTEVIHVENGDDLASSPWRFEREGGTGQLTLPRHRQRPSLSYQEAKLNLQNLVVYYRCELELKYRKYFWVAEIRDKRLTQLLEGRQRIWDGSSSYFRREPLSLQLNSDPQNIDSKSDTEDRWVVVISFFESVRSVDYSPKFSKLGDKDVLNDGQAKARNDARERKTAPQLAWPNWVQRDRIVSEHFVGVLRGGFLFAGTEPDQYFWFSYGRGG